MERHSLPQEVKMRGNPQRARCSATENVCADQLNSGRRRFHADEPRVHGDPEQQVAPRVGVIRPEAVVEDSAKDEGLWDLRGDGQRRTDRERDRGERRRA